MKIDVHHHWMAKEHHDTVEKYLRKGERVVRVGDTWHIWRKNVQLTRSNPKLYDIDEQIEDMDAAGIDMSIQFLYAWQEWNTMKICAYQNDYLANIIARHPKRFFGIAHVPPMGGKAAMRELERAIRELGFKGVVITTHVRGVSVDSERLWPLYEKAAELDIPVVITPYSTFTETNPLEGKAAFLNASLARLENPHRATIRLIYSGVMDRFPTLKFLLPHLGATFWAIRNRLHPSFFQWWQSDSTAEAIKPVDDPAARHMERLYFDTAAPIFWREGEFKCAIQNLGEDHICFASDYPINPGFMKDGVAMMEGLNLDQRTKEKIYWQNAARLFKLDVGKASPRG